jgi:hypothetical protein
MAFGTSFLRAGAAVALLCACGSDGVIVAEAEAATPTLAWQGATSLRILCLVGPAARPDAAALQDELCETVRGLAAEGAPIPVSRVGFGDPAVIQPATATLLVHASIEDDAGSRLMAVSLRAFRPGGVETAQLFGAAPRAVRLGASGPGGKPLRAAAAAMLADTLPWRQGH